MIAPLAWYIALLAGALLLLIAEVFLPGGIAGTFGVLALVGAVALGLVIFPPPWGFLAAIGVVVGGGVFFLLWVKLFPRSSAGRRIALQVDLTNYKSLAPPPPELIGVTGETLTALRPAGIATLDGKRHDVLADGGEWLPAGANIRVCAIRNGQIIVCAADSP